MTNKNHSEIAAGSRHAIHNLEYASAAAREADTTLTAANLYQIATQTYLGEVTHWFLVDIGPPLVWKQVLTADATDETTVAIIEGGWFKLNSEPLELADGEFYDLPDDAAGFGVFMAVEIGTPALPEICDVHWNIDGVVTSRYLSTNAAITDVASSLCVFDNGSVPRVKNNLGYSIYLIFDFDYCLNYLT